MSPEPRIFLMASKKTSVTSNQNFSFDNDGVAVENSINVKTGRVNVEAGVTVDEESTTTSGSVGVNNGVVGGEVSVSHERSHDGNYTATSLTGGVSAGLHYIDTTAGLEVGYSKSMQKNDDGTTTITETISTGVKASVVGNEFDVGTFITENLTTINIQGDTLSQSTTTEFTSDILADEPIESRDMVAVGETWGPSHNGTPSPPTSADSAIGAGFGDENGEFGSTPTSDASSSSQSDQDWNNPTNPGDQSNTTVSDSPYSTKMDRDYGVTQSSFEAAMKAMSKMGNTDYYKTPTSVLHNPGSNKKQEVKNPDDPNAGQASSSPQGLTPDQRDALGGYGKYSSDRDNSPVSQSSSSSSSGDWSGVGRSSIDNPTNSPSYSSNPSSGGPSYGPPSVSSSYQGSSSGRWSGVGRSSMDNPANAPSYSSSPSSGGPSYGPPSVSSSYRGSGSSNHSDSGNSNSGSGKPIVMDMDGDGVELIPMANNNALFDMDADGYREMITANPERAMHATTHLR